MGSEGNLFIFLFFWFEDKVLYRFRDYWLLGLFGCWNKIFDNIFRKVIFFNGKKVDLVIVIKF